jgi:hypothetical protein
MLLWLIRQCGRAANISFIKKRVFFVFADWEIRDTALQCICNTLAHPTTANVHRLALSCLAAPAVAPLLRDHEANVRASALSALGAFARHAAEAAAAVRIAHNGGDSAKSSAQWPTVGALMFGFGLSDSDAYVRRAALVVLDAYTERELFLPETESDEADFDFATALLSASVLLANETDWEVKLRLLRLLLRVVVSEPLRGSSECCPWPTAHSTQDLLPLLPSQLPLLHAAEGPVAEQVRQLCARLSDDADPVVRYNRVLLP